MMPKALRVLIVEDSEDDAELLVRALTRGGYEVSSERVETADAMRGALARTRWDLVISDYVLPTLDAPGALAVLKESEFDLPFLIVSGTIGEETAVAALKSGAHDFLVKGRLARLLPAIERELREAAGRRKRRSAEAALRASEAKYRRIVETAQEGIWVLDQDQRTTYVNRRLAELLESNQEALIGSFMLDFVEEEWKSAAASCLGPARVTRATANELKFRRGDGHEFWGSLSASAIFDEDSRRIGTLLMVTDLTEQRRLQAQLMVSDRLVSVGTLAAGVAHEINNPLASVIANLELALPGLEGAAGNTPALSELREQLRDAREAARRVQHIVRDLKVFSRAQEERVGAVDLRPVLDSVIRLAWNEIRHRARLVKDYGEVPLVRGNESRLGQVFLNLVINAAQAIPDGRADRNEIRLSVMRVEGGAAVEIRDTGPGMDADVLGRLFTPFFTTKPVGVGTGLGLSICHRIITSLGGQITVDSTLGEGSVFRVVLPEATAPPSFWPESEPSAAHPPSRGRVLVVDDEPMMVKVVQRMLAPEHDIVGSTSAREALDAIADGARYDAILCDLMMPFVTGMDFYLELRKLASEQAERVIFLTGGAFTPRMRDFLDEVRNLRVEKPFEPASLRSIVNARVAQSQTRS